MKLVDILINIVIILLVIILVSFIISYFSNYEYPFYFDTPLDRLVRDGNYDRLALPPFYNRGVPRIHYPMRWRRRWRRRWFF